jgi:hypothetical protein
MPVLGLIASQISGHLFAPSGAYDSIATVTVGAGGTSSVNFSSIPQTYTHLQIRAIHQEPSDTMALQFNTQTGNAYTVHSLLGDGGAVAAAYNASPSMIYFGTNYGSSGSNFGASVVDILDYTNTNKYRTVRSLTGADNNSVYGKVGIYSGEYYGTSAVTSIQILGRTSGTIAQYSSFALYGIRGN